MLFLKSMIPLSFLACASMMVPFTGSAAQAASDPPTVESTTSASTLSTTTARKYNPGQYIALLPEYGSQAYMAGSLKPGVKGFMKRYKWRDLEPTQGNYDFSEIRSDLAWTAAYGMRLIVMIEDKSFRPVRLTPAYLNAYSLRNSRGGYTPARWNPYVAGRMKALVVALGRFDGHWNFEGIATQETALTLDSWVLDAHGYTPEKYRDFYINVLTAAGNAMPRSRVFWFMNFLPRKQAYIGTIANAVAGKGVVMGGPDVLPDDKPLRDLTYPFYDQFRHKMPLFGQVEGECYAALHKTCCYPTKYWTMPELFRYARDRLHVDYMFWVRVTIPSHWNSYDWTHALPVIRNNPTFNN
jgi:hypothetical protein